MRNVANLSGEELTQSLSYAGFVLVAFELVKELIVEPIKVFYADIAFGDGMPFKSYEIDVRSRHQNEFEACLLYLRDFMDAIDSEDFLAIQGLRKHRNDLAHDLVKKLHNLNIDDYLPLLERADKALFKLSNYRTYMEIGTDPEFQNVEIDWETVYGNEYMIFRAIVKKINLLQDGHSEA